MRPQIKYARNGDVHIAYSVLGAGPIDLIVIQGFVSNISMHHDHPLIARFYNEIASFSRLIQFDKRGTGLSDRPTDFSTMDERISDLSTVMDAVNSEKAVLFGSSEGGSLAMLFAAIHPERVHCLITFGAFASRIKSMDYPWAPTAQERYTDVAEFTRMWSKPSLDTLAPGVANDQMSLEWWAKYIQNSASPTAVYNIYNTNTKIDVRDILPSIHVPAMIMHMTGDRDANVEEGRWIAGQIPNGQFVELEGDAHLAFFGDSEVVVDKIRNFTKEATQGAPPSRALATIVFADIVGSTQLASELGDRAWRSKWEQFVSITKSLLSKSDSKLIKTTGDGFLATFEGPAQAVITAKELLTLVEPIGVEVRVGVHTGEIELIDGDIAGIGVHIASRVMDAAGAGEVVVSSTVKDITAGAGLQLEEIGERELKGVQGVWRLYRAL